MAARRRRPDLQAGIHGVAEAVEKSTKNIYNLLTWEKLEQWQHDNHYIVSGYRMQSNSTCESLKSLCYFHNESINVYTHLLGGIAFLSTGVYLYYDLQSRYPTCTRADLLAFAIFLLSATSCFLLSASCHLISNHSPTGARLGTSLDYLGIVVFIDGTCVSGFYYGLRLHKTLLYAYCALILLVGTACAAVAMSPVFHTPRWRPVRAATFIGLGLMSVIPIMHGIYLYGFETLEKMMGLKWSFIQGFFYVLGCVIFASRVPERWYPGNFDLLGASHQLFHVCALVAAVSQLNALLSAIDYVHGQTPN